MVIMSPSANFLSDGTACGCAPFSPPATIVSKEGSKPRCFIFRLISSAISISVTPGLIRGRISVKIFCVNIAAMRSRLISSGVFTTSISFCVHSLPFVIVYLHHCLCIHILRPARFAYHTGRHVFFRKQFGQRFKIGAETLVRENPVHLLARLRKLNLAEMHMHGVCFFLSDGVLQKADYFCVILFSLNASKRPCMQ